jgi:hypothetical protein
MDTNEHGFLFNRRFRDECGLENEFVLDKKLRLKHVAYET